MQFALLGRTTTRVGRPPQGLAQVTTPPPPLRTLSLSKSQRTFTFVNCASGFHYAPKRLFHPTHQQQFIVQSAYRLDQRSTPLWKSIDNPWLVSRTYTSNSNSARNNNNGGSMTYYLSKAKEFFVNVAKGVGQLIKNTQQARVIRAKKRAGIPITRKEFRFLAQNRKDWFTVIPILLLIKIPILGKLILLTLVVKFPWILPSTFGFLKPPVPLRKRLEDTELYKKFVLARFPKTPELKITKPVQYPLTPASAKELSQLYAKELSLDRLNNVQLSSLCMAMGLSGWGFDFMLRDRITSHLGVMNIEDQMLSAEGLTKMSEDDLEEACKERGLFAELDEAKLQSQLSAWLQMSQENPDNLLKLLMYHHAFVKVPLWLSTNPSNGAK